MISKTTLNENKSPSQNKESKKRAKIRALFIELRKSGVPDDGEDVEIEKENTKPEEINPLNSMFSPDTLEDLSQSPAKDKIKKQKLVDILKGRLIK